MQPKTSFFHHFNPKPKTYSDSEIRFQIEVVARVKRGMLTDGERMKIIIEKSLSISNECVPLQ